MLLLDLIPDVKVDTGSAGVLGFLPQGYSRRLHGGRVGVLDEICDQLLPFPEEPLVVICHYGAHIHEGVHLEGVQHVIRVSYTEIRLKAKNKVQ